MAAAKSGPAKGAGGKKPIRGHLPTKRSINLVLVDENRINPLKAILGILLIVALAALFGKYMVADRLVAVSNANSRVARLNENLRDAQQEIKSYGDVEQSYAHYTYAGMTKAEMGLVDRTRIMKLVGKIFEAEVKPMTWEEFLTEFRALLDMFKPENAPFIVEDFQARFDALVIACQPVERMEKKWTVTENLLTVEMTGESLESMNELAQEVEQDPIVDSCTIITANKGKNTRITRGIWARMIIYLCQPVEEEVAES